MVSYKITAIALAHGLFYRSERQHLPKESSGNIRIASGHNKIIHSCPLVIVSFFSSTEGSISSEAIVALILCHREMVLRGDKNLPGVSVIFKLRHRAQITCDPDKGESHQYTKYAYYNQHLSERESIFSSSFTHKTPPFLYADS